MSTSPLVLYAIPHTLTSDECDALIAKFVTASSDVVESLQTRSRIQFDDPQLAARIFGRLYDHIPVDVEDEFGYTWIIHSMNPHFRLVRYTEGQRFDRHEDGFSYMSSPLPDATLLRTFVSVNVYLNDVPADNGGVTHFIDHGVSVQPRKGMASVFEVNNVFHEGRAVTSGEKYILRTDIVYYMEPNHCPDAFTWSLQWKLADTWLTSHMDNDDSPTAWDEFQDAKNKLRKELSTRQS